MVKHEAGFADRSDSSTTNWFEGSRQLLKKFTVWLSRLNSFDPVKVLRLFDKIMNSPPSFSRDNYTMQQAEDEYQIARNKCDRCKRKMSSYSFSITLGATFGFSVFAIWMIDSLKSYSDTVHIVAMILLLIVILVFESMVIKYRFLYYLKHYWISAKRCQDLDACYHLGHDDNWSLFEQADATVDEPDAPAES